jgi:penicillin-binding protein-related factor A (putative recombinase)
MTEKQIETSILTYLNHQPNTLAFKINTVGVFDPKRQVFRKNLNPFVIPGCSDILGLHQGRFFAIEVKTPVAYRRFVKSLTLKPNELRQKLFLESVSRRGGLSLMACSVDQVIEWFNKNVRKTA